ncbi:MAG TPA: tetratricopeptide repeat protein, partial [Novosphingobium sp.]|nr:tetratricopeptide repeat protein [Novosphingobium sp.]
MVARWIWNRPAAHPAAWAAGAAAGALGGLMMAGPAALAQGLPAGVQGGAAAQGGGSYAVVQPLPVAADPGHALDAALSRLARNPLDPGALVAAGDAALAMGDSDAAIGFYTRAERVAPGNAHARAGLAGARLRAGEPLEAVDLFDRAARDGALSGDQIADRGLAYDMLGDNGSAQRFYREALANGAGDEAVRRLALSQAMAGDARAVEITLAPLLQRQDRAAWRTKAFAFAILGREEEAVAVARSTMPTQLAEAIAPYLRFMRRLTPAQQAAAANLGRFPRASDIGQDDPKIAAWAAAHGVKRLALAEASPAAGPPRPEAPAPDKARKPRRPRPATLPEDADSAPGEPTPSREEPALPPAGAAAAATPAPQPAYPPAPAFSLAPAAPRAPAQPTVALPPPAAPAPAQPAAAGARQATAFPIVQRRPQAAPASAPVSAPA